MERTQENKRNSDDHKVVIPRIRRTISEHFADAGKTRRRPIVLGEEVMLSALEKEESHEVEKAVREHILKLLGDLESLTYYFEDTEDCGVSAQMKKKISEMKWWIDVLE